MTFEQELMRVRSAYFLDGWLKFNEEMWGYKAERVMYTLPGKERPALEGVLYLTKSGKVRMPPCNAYLPLQFYATPTDQPYRLYEQWSSVVGLFAADIKKRGLVGTINFNPGFLDGRAFQWLGFNTTLRYTFVSPLPYLEGMVDVSVKKKYKKAQKNEYIVQRTFDWDKVLFCLKKTADFQKFDIITTEKLFSRCRELLGDNVLVSHLAYSKDGFPVSTQVSIAMSGGLSVAWCGGTDREHMPRGANQYLYANVLKDLAALGVKYSDYCGANMEFVARAKAAWGFPLVPYISLVDNSLPQKTRRFIASYIPGARTAYHKLSGLLRGGN